MRQKLRPKPDRATEESLNFWAFVNLLNSSAQSKYFRFIIVHSFLSLIEVVSVMCIAFLGLRSLTIFSNRVNSSKEPFLLDLNVASFSFTLGAREVFILFGFFLILLVIKNFLALFLYYKLSGFLADLGESLSLSLFKKLLDVSPLRKKNLDRSETSAALTDSIYSGVLLVLGQFVLLFSETILMVLMFIGLLVYEPIITLILLFLAGFVFIFSFSRIRDITFTASKNTALINAHSKNLVQETMNFAEVIYFQNRGHFFVQNFLKDLIVRGSNFKKLQTSQQSPKYFLDIIFLSSILLFAVFQFFSQNYIKGIEIFAVFLLVSSRIGPALLRAQNGLLAMQRGFGFSFLYFKFHQFLNSVLDDGILGISKIPVAENFDFPTLHVTAKNLRLNVPNIYENSSLLQPFNFDFKVGDIVGVSGPSGVGKSTLLETVTGLRSPQSGEILISGYSPSNFMQLFPLSVFYSRQNSNLLSGTIMENIVLEANVSQETEAEVIFLLTSVGLTERINALEFGVHTPITPESSFFSSGEEQRILVARALYFNARIIVLDESTNALDAISEQNLLDLLKQISENRIIFIISHRSELINQCTKILKLK